MGTCLTDNHTAWYVGGICLTDNHTTWYWDLPDWQPHYLVWGSARQTTTLPSMRICLTDNHTTWYGDLPDWQPHHLVWGSAWLTTTLPVCICIPWSAILLNCHLEPYPFFFFVSPHIHRCVDYYSLIIFLWHHTILRHICDVTMFQTIVMSQVAICDVMMSNVCCCCCQGHQ